MAEDQPSQEILKQLVERLDLMERVLGTNTARLHSIEQNLGIENHRQPLPEPLASERRETPPAASQIGTEDLKTAEPTQAQTPPQTPPQPRSTPVAAQVPEPAMHTWATSEPPESPATHSWMNETSAPRTYPRREATAPLGLHAPVEMPAAADDSGHAAAVRERKRRDLESAIGGRWFNWITSSRSL